MRRVLQRLFPVAGLAVAVLAAGVTVRVWLGERALAEGQAAQRRGDLNAAAAAYGIAAGNGNADAAIERTRILLLRRDWAGAAGSVREALSLAPARAYPYVLQAQLEAQRPGAWDREREERVIGACRNAAALDQSGASTWRQCGGILLRLAATRRPDGDADRTRAIVAEAADAYAEALGRDPGAAPAVVEKMLSETGDPGLVIEVASRRGNPAVLVAAVALLVERELWTQAEPGFWALAGARGAVPAFAAAAAEALARRSLNREALAAARRGLLAAPADAALALRAADSAARLPGQEALTALPLYRDAVAADPANTAARKRFAAFLAARERLGEAERELRAAVGGNPKDADAWYALGEVLRRSGRPAEAAVAYRAAADLRPGNAAFRRAAGGPSR